MASSADNSTALKVMSDANSDFLAFISNIQAFFRGDSPVTFNIAGGLTVSSLMMLINDYRNGVFDRLTIGSPSGDNGIVLSFSDGKLYVTDNAGNLAEIECSVIKSSVIEDSTALNVTAKGARIDSVVGSVSVSGGNVSLKSLKLDYLRATRAVANSVTVKSLSVDTNLQCNRILSYGARKFSPRSVRSVFYRNNAPLNNAVSYMHIDTTTDNWDMVRDSTGLTPLDLGFKSWQSGILSGTSVPDLVRIMGYNRYGDFVQRGTQALSWLRGTPLMKAPPNVMAGTAVQGASSYFVAIDGSRYEMAALMLWPTGICNLSVSEGFLYLMTFSASDSGKEIYYQVLSEAWKIYRVMRVTYSPTNPNAPVSIEFDGLVELPAYTCTRFIARIHDLSTEVPRYSGSRVVLHTLEYA